MLYELCAIEELLKNAQLASGAITLIALQLLIEKLNVRLHSLYIFPDLTSTFLVLVEEHVCVNDLVKGEVVVTLDQPLGLLVIAHSTETKEQDLRSLQDPRLLEAPLPTFLDFRHEIFHLVLKGLIPGLVDSMVPLDVQIDRT